MNQILIIIAIVGIGYLLYRSLVIKRQSADDNDQMSNTSATENKTPAAQRESAEAKPLTAHNPHPRDPEPREQDTPAASPPTAEKAAVDPQATESEADHTVAADGQVGSAAVEEAHQAEVKAAEKAHMETAGKVTRSKLEQHINSGADSHDTPSVPAEVETQAGALRETEEPLARHRLYQQIVEHCYRARDERSGRVALLYYAQAHIAEFDDIVEPLKKQNGGKLPQVATFKHYAAVLTESGQYDEAIAVCEKALSYGLKDGTKTGYQGRLQRIEKLKAKHQG